MGKNVSDGVPEAPPKITLKQAAEVLRAWKPSDLAIAHARAICLTKSADDMTNFVRTVAALDASLIEENQPLGKTIFEGITE